MTSSEIKPKYPWDEVRRRPIVGDTTTNARTGIIQAAGTKVIAGPPSINAMWINWHSDMSYSGPECPPPRWRSVRMALNCEIGDVLCHVAEQVKGRAYRVISLNASAYSLVIVCRSRKTYTEFGEVVQRMADLLHADAGWATHPDRVRPAQNGPPPQDNLPPDLQGWDI